MAGIQFLSECGTIESVIPLVLQEVPKSSGADVRNAATGRPPTNGYHTSRAVKKPRPATGAVAPNEEVPATLSQIVRDEVRLPEGTTVFTNPVPLWRLLEDEFHKQRVLRVLAKMNREH